MNPHSFRKLPDDILTQRFNDLCKGDGAHEGHGMWPYLPVLHQLAAMETSGPGPCVALEIGVHTGQSTIALLAALNMVPDSALISIDIKPPVGDLVKFIGRCHETGALRTKWEFIGGDSTSPAITELAKVIVAHNSRYTREINLLFADGAFENRLEDLETYGPLVRTLGSIVVHDTNRALVDSQVKTYLQRARFSHRQAVMTLGHGLTVISKRMPYGASQRFDG